MATLVSTTGTEFTPSAGDFIASSSNGPALLMRKNTTGAAYAVVGIVSGAIVVSNPVGGAVYRFDSYQGSIPTVQADQ